MTVTACSRSIPSCLKASEDQLEGQPAATQFSRALDELGIGSIAAHSPEAKGRIERLWRTFQDRLVVELALAAVTDIKAANRFLPACLQRFNDRFAVQAEEPGLAYRPLEASLDLERILSFRYRRVVARDNTVRLGGHLIQIPPGPKRRSYFAAHVWVHELLDGSLGVCYQDQWLVRGDATKLDAVVRARKRKPEAPERPPLLPRRLPSRPEPVAATAAAASAVRTPAPSHLWRHASTFATRQAARTRTESRSS